MWFFRLVVVVVAAAAAVVVVVVVVVVPVIIGIIGGTFEMWVGLESSSIPGASFGGRSGWRRRASATGAKQPGTSLAPWRCRSV